MPDDLFVSTYLNKPLRTLAEAEEHRENRRSWIEAAEAMLGMDGEIQSRQRRSADLIVMRLRRAGGV